MTELEVFEHGAAIGTLRVEREGLFLHFTCRIRPKAGELLRLYAISGWHSEYLGIPYPQGQEAALDVRLAASHFPSEPAGAVADVLPRGEWLPWCGELDGVPVRRCRIRRQEGSILLALSEEEAKLFPGWLGNMEQTEIQGERRMLLRLNADGTPPFSEEAPEAPLPAMPEEPAAEVQEAAEEPQITTEKNE